MRIYLEKPYMNIKKQRTFQDKMQLQVILNENGCALG